MKCLIINASPRPGSLIKQMMSEAAAHASEKGMDVQSIDLYDTRIEYCTGCCACRAADKCVLPHDDAHDIAEQIRLADMLIIGTPTYWGDMSSKLKTLFDRLVYVFAELPPDSFPKPRLKGRKAVVVATCSTPYPFNILFRQSSGAVRQVKEVLGTAGFRTKAVQIAGTMNMRRPPEGKIRTLKKAMDKLTEKHRIR